MLELAVELNQNIVVEESHISSSMQAQVNRFGLIETDLSFYGSLGTGLCSGTASSGGAVGG